MSSDVICDVLVIGSGAGGLASAVSARKHGANVLLIEKEDRFGGTTAVSGGGLWVPMNDQARRLGVQDSLDEARSYIREQAGNKFHSDLIDVYLREGPRALTFFEENTAVRFDASLSPDHHTEVPGSKSRGRSVLTRPYDARRLGNLRDRIVKPYREQTLWGMPVPLDQLRFFQTAARSVTSARIVLAHLLRYGIDVIRYGKSVRLFNGAALAGRLVRSAIDAGVVLWPSTRAVSLHLSEAGVQGATAIRDGRTINIVARRGVVLACGGFAHDSQRHQREMVHVRGTSSHVSLSPTSNTGDGINMAEAIGVKVVEGYEEPVYWMPVSRVPRKNGTFGLFPHSGSDRGKPGFLVVNRSGHRFVSEAAGYHKFVRAMLGQGCEQDEPAAFIICDHRAIRTYGLGFAKPFPLPLGRHIRSGYIVRDKTIPGLAAQLGVDPAALVATVAKFNENAARGVDPDFNEGANAFERGLGDPWHKPHPNLAPLHRGPFYGVKVVPADVGTFIGLQTDAYGRAVTEEGEAIPNLYAVGADMANIFGGHSPGGGITLGPALTFGYLIGKRLGEASCGHSTSRENDTNPKTDKG